MFIKFLKQAFFALALITLSACSGTTLQKPEQPQFSVASIKPTTIGLSQQTFLFTLKADNPNNYPIDINGVDFKANLSNQHIADGKSQQKFTLKPNGETLFDIEVSTQLVKSLTDLATLLQGQGLNFNYAIEGKLDVAKSPVNIPFNVDGNILDFIQR